MLHRLKNIEGYILSMTFVSLALIATVQVVCRYLFGISFTWFEEGSRYVGVFATFLGASLAVDQGSHFATEIMSGLLSSKARQYQRAFVGMVSGVFLATLAYYGFRLVLKQYGFGATSPTIGAPMYLVYLPIPVFSLIMALRFFKAVIDVIRGTESLSEASENRSDAGKGSML